MLSERHALTLCIEGKMPLKVWEKNVREIKNDVAKHAAYNYCGLFFSFFFWIVIQRSRGWMCLSELLCVICSEFLPAPSKQEKLTRGTWKTSRQATRSLCVALSLWSYVRREEKYFKVANGCLRHFHKVLAMFSTTSGTLIWVILCLSSFYNKSRL